MKKLLLSACAIVALCFSGRISVAQTSPLDPSFGTGGISLLDSVDAFYSVDMSLQTDGKILIAVDGNCGHGFLCRLLANGKLDPSFTPSPSYRTYPVYHPGVIEMQGRACNAHMTAVRQLSNRKVLLAVDPIGILQYNADGTTDSTFGVAGITSITNSSPNTITSIYDLKEIPGTGVLFAGGTFPPPMSDSLSLARMKYNGALDASFGSGGYVRVALPVSQVGAQSLIQCIRILPDNRVLVAGHCITPGSPTGIDIFMALYKTNGTLDATFGNNGVKLIDFNGAWDDVFDIAYRDNNNIYMLGATGKSRIVFKINIAGVVDQSFGSGGLATFPYASSNGNLIYYGAVTSGNTLYTSIDTGATQRCNYFSYNGTGSANTRFGGTGIYYPGTRDRVSNVLAQPDNKVLVLGTDGVHPRLMRFTGNGPTGVGSISQAGDIGVWSAGGQCFVKFGQKEQSFNVALLGMDGKLLGRWSAQDCSVAGERTYSFALPSGLPQGVYLIRVDSRAGSITLRLAL